MPAAPCIASPSVAASSAPRRAASSRSSSASASADRGADEGAISAAADAGSGVATGPASASMRRIRMIRARARVSLSSASGRALSSLSAVGCSAGSAGAYALYINATGTNVEGLKVDAGAVVFDETLLVTGAATFSSTVATGALTVTGAATVSTTLAVSGQFTASAAVLFNGTETIAAGGTSTALSLTKTVHYIDADAGGDIFTLADGVNGQVAFIMLTSSTGLATVTPANLAGGTSVTLNADGDSVLLMFMDTEWFIMGGNSYAVI